jgi:hypothetical protein
MALSNRNLTFDIFDTTNTDAAGVADIKGPLRALETNDLFTQDFLQYPEDLDSEYSRKHWVEFYVNLVETSAYAAAAPAGQNNVDTTNDFFNFDTGIGPKKNGFSFQIAPPRKTLKTVIKLYMPDTVQTSYVNSYQEDNINDYSIPKFGQSILGLGGDVKKILSGEKKFDMGEVSTFTNPNLLALIKEAVGGKIPVDVLLKGKGYAINPQVQLLFKATALRTFQMTFLFTPYSQNEAKSVQNIIKQFKFHAAPEIGGGTGNGQGLFFIPPSTFNLKYFYNGQENTSINKYGECVLENIDIDYATNGWITYPDGSPVQTRLTLSFKEIDIIDKKKISDGGY